MPKFFVTVTRDTTESTTVDVVAENAADAERLALEEATRSPHNFDWAQDECSGGDPYIPAPGESADIAEENCRHCGEDRPLGPDTGATWTCGGCNAFVEPSPTVDEPAPPPTTRPADGPYSPELAEAFRIGARELCNSDLGDRINVDNDARVEEYGEGDGGAIVHCTIFVSDGERAAMAGEDIS